MDELVTGVVENQRAVAIIVTALLLLLAEVGYRLGRRLYASADDARKSQMDVARGAVLGLLALLMGFTFSMAVARYDTRRRLVVQEANAIGTTWLRAGLLPEAHHQVVRDLLKDYVDVRIRMQAEARDPARVAEGLRKTGEIQSTLWTHAEAAGVEARDPVTATFVETLNDMIDTSAERHAAARSRIPAGVWLILIILAGAGCCVSAYGAGAVGIRSAFTNVMFPLLISVVIVLIFDIMHEGQGIVRVSQQPMLDLQNSLRSQAARVQAHPSQR
jgi:hypothetical protein